ncbi:MAG: insulinase family protein [Kofleriaceae bacterium]|nr:insulinase family protein [Kofleriaceae bacterium]
MPPAREGRGASAVAPGWWRHDDGWRAVVLPAASPGRVTLVFELGVGAADDPPGRAGAAHLLEHVIFRAGHLGPGVEALGGQARAFTDPDRLWIEADVPAPAAARAAAQLATALARVRIDPADVEHERALVALELAATRRDSGAVLRDELMRRMFVHHPYRLPVIGTATSVAAIRVADLAGLVDRWWSTRNLRVIVRGGEGPTVLGVVADALRPMARHGVARPGRGEEAPRAPRAAVVASTGRRQLALAWRWSSGAASAAMAELLAAVLAVRWPGLVLRRLPLREAGLLVATTTPARAADATRRLRRALADLTPSLDELAAARVRAHAAGLEVALGADVDDGAAFAAAYARQVETIAPETLRSASAALASAAAVAVATYPTRGGRVEPLLAALGADRPAPAAATVGALVAPARTRRPRPAPAPALATLELAFAPPPPGLPARVAHAVLVGALGGEGGALALRLRRKHALAYHLLVDGGLDDGLAITVACAPADRGEVERAVDEVLRASMALPAAALRRARARVHGAHAQRREVTRVLRSLTEADVAALARRRQLVDAAHRRWSTPGPATRVTEAAITRRGAR